MASFYSQNYRSSRTLHMANKKARTKSSADGMDQDLHGRIFFEKRMTSHSLSQLSPQLILPMKFVREHGDQIQKSVTLRIGADGRRWTVDTHIVFQPRLQLLFQAGWKAFAVANGLCVDDRVTFVLVAMSLFEVHIARRKEAQSKLDKLGALTEETLQCPADEPQNTRCGMRKEEPEVALKGVYEKKETSCVPMDTDSSQMPSDMDLHFFEPMVQECVSEHLDVEKKSCDQAQVELPNFLTRLTKNETASCFKGLEIPRSFVKTHSTRIGARIIKLQGIEEDSAVYDVTCWRSRQKRWFLGSGWSKFASDNLLRTGQRVVCILIADSFLVVRNI